MAVLLFFALLGLAVIVGRVWQEVRDLKAQAFLTRAREQEAATEARIRALRTDAERRIRHLGRGW